MMNTPSEKAIYNAVDSRESAKIYIRSKRRMLSSKSPTSFLKMSILLCLIAASAFCNAQQETSRSTQGGTIKPEQIFSQEQIEAFERDGYLFVSNLLDQDHLEQFLQAGEAFVNQQSRKTQYDTFSVVETGMIYDVPFNKSSADGSENCVDGRQVLDAFRFTALRSKFAQASAELMQLDPETQNLRVIRDVFLAKPVNATRNCDWHVDDQSFWPESFLSSASQASGKDQYGINVWIAMDDMPARYGGSMAVAKGSHKADWRHDGYRAIGQDRSVDGGTSKEKVYELFSSGNFNGTCDMGSSDPELQKRIEQTKVVFDIKKGDAIFATRLCFHRTLAVTEEGKKYFADLGKDLLSRYSIRYVPGSARLASGYNLEHSLVLNDDYRGRSLDEVAVKKRGVWYPQVWPTLEKDLDQKLETLAKTELHEAKTKYDIEVAEFRNDLRAAMAKKADGKKPYEELNNA